MSAPARYRSLVQQVEAIRWETERDCQAVCDFTGLPHAGFDEELDHSKLHIPTEPDTVTAVRGDWVVRFPDGRYEVWADEAFHAAFVAADQRDGSGYVVVSRDDLRAHLLQDTDSPVEEQAARDRLKAAAGIED